MNCDIQTISYTDCILSIFDSNGYPIAEFRLADTKITANYKAETLTITDGSSIMIINASQLSSINGGAFATLLDLYTYLETQRNLCQCGCGGGGGGNIDSINGDTTPAQTLSTGTSGTDFNIVDDGLGDHEFNIPTASATNRGALSTTDWSNFNSKEPAITVLPISKGGTNSSTALVNNRVMQSSGGAIVEAPAITANRALISDANGIPIASSVSNTTLAYLDATSSVQTQINAKAIGIINCNPNDTIAALTTSYWQPFSNAADAAETSRVWYSNVAGTMKYLLFRSGTSQPATGNQVITLRHELASTSITLTIAAGSAAGTFTDYVNTHTVAQGDRISIQSVNNATATAGAQANQITFIIA